jgi:5-methylcytosine-specific restriction endonuclease McrA
MITTGKLGIIRCTGVHLTMLREACFARDEWFCQECGRWVSTEAPEWADNCAHMAHIIGLGRGGSDILENTVTKCRKCHIDIEHRGGKVVPAK